MRMRDSLVGCDASPRTATSLQQCTPPTSTPSHTLQQSKPTSKAELAAAMGVVAAVVALDVEALGAVGAAGVSSLGDGGTWRPATQQSRQA